MEPVYGIAGIDVHKKMLAVVVVDWDDPQTVLERRKFGTHAGELKHLAQWLSTQRVSTVVMESTAQYWKPVWMALEGEFEVHLAQAQSNAAVRGRKTDFKDSLRLVRRFLSAELSSELGAAWRAANCRRSVSECGCKTKSKPCWKKGKLSCRAPLAIYWEPVAGESWRPWPPGRSRLRNWPSWAAPACEPGRSSYGTH